MLIACCSLAGIAFSQSASTVVPATVKYFTNKEGAIRGYDAVAYFTEGKAVKGNQPFIYNWNGSDWLFSSQANLDLFKADPVKYAPQFGGYCAYGVSENHQSPTDPAAFTIVEEKLYLNYSSKVKELWMKNRDERIKQANIYWPQLNQSN
ncbi:MAG: YHS domain-containing protein [Rhizobacter sp.]|nr:YHS domain-containing protein [Ferruginibacter sp.]